MLRRLGVRGKILATLAVPVLVLFVGATLLSIGAIADSRLERATSQVVDSLRAQDALTRALQAERTAAFDYTLLREGAVESFEEAQKQTDAAVADLNAAADKINLGPLDDRLVEAIENASAARTASSLNKIRSLFVDADTVLTRTVDVQYGHIIDSQMRVSDVAADRMSDRELSRIFQGYNAVDRSINQISLDSKLAEIVLADFMQGNATPRGLRSVAVDITNGDLARQQADSIVQELAIPGVQMPVEFFTYSLVRAALANAAPGNTTVTQRMTWPALSDAEIDAIIPVRDSLRDRTIAAAANNSANQQRQTLATIAIVVLTLAASVTIAVFVARRITEPLRRLTAAATHVRAELPKLVEQVAVPGQGPATEFERIPIEDNDEVGLLATAFNDVNATTLEIAREQALLRGSIAEMFVNVARRDQVLLSRQLAFLDELERSEEDPNTLANLFRLDHLATRMRRNAESLLVLAGIESGRRVRDPMPLSDVIRTAASEIEQYDRIQLEIQTDPHILGHNALVAAHLLAELLENATVFSDPGSPVYVSESEDERWVSIVVRDEGLGMSAEEIDEANEKATTYAGGEIAGQSRLGLYVVGRLSYKLGATVRFRNLESEGKDGTEVRVMLPRELFLADSEVPLQAPIDPLSAQTQAATQAWVRPEATRTQQQPAYTPQFQEEEPPVAVPVDLAALTDGSTATGMPRRRSRTADAAAPAPSAGLAPTPDERDIVLPPLQATELPSSFIEDDEAAWTPLSVPEPSRAELPSRAPRAAASVPVEPVAPEALQSAPVPERASMFSAFRTRKDLDVVADDALTGTSEFTPYDGEQGQEPQAAEDGSELPTRTARREARSAASGMTGELPAVPELVEDEPEAAQYEQQPQYEPQYEPQQPQYEAPAQYETPVQYEAPAQYEQQPQYEAPVIEEQGPAAHTPSAIPEFNMGDTGVEEFVPVQRFEIPNLQDGGLPSRESVRPDAAAQQQHNDFVVPGLADDFGNDFDYGQQPQYEPQVHYEAQPQQPQYEAPAQYGTDQDQQHGQYAPIGLVPDEPAPHYQEPTQDGQYYQPESQVGYQEQAYEQQVDRQQPQHQQAQYQQEAPFNPGPVHGVAVFDGAVLPDAAAPLPDFSELVGRSARREAEQSQRRGLFGLKRRKPAKVSKRDRKEQQEEAAATGQFRQAVLPPKVNRAQPAPLDGFVPVPRETQQDQFAQQPQQAARAEHAPSTQSGWSAPTAGSAPSWSAPTPTSAAPAASQGQQANYGQQAGDQTAQGAPAGNTAGAYQPQMPGQYSPEPHAGGFAPLTGVGPAARDGKSAAGFFSGTRRAGGQPDEQRYEPQVAAQAPAAPQAQQPVVQQPAAQQPAAQAPAQPAPSDFTYTPQMQEQSWAPTFSDDITDGAGGYDPSAQLALQAGIQAQALSELSQLSSYRPNQMGTGSAGNLTKRVRSNVPDSTDDLSSQKISRDAAELRARLSAFVSATNRARETTDDNQDQVSAEMGADHATPDPAPQSN